MIRWMSLKSGFSVEIVAVAVMAGCGTNEVTSVPKGFSKAEYCYPGNTGTSLGLSAIFDRSGGLLPDSEVNSDQVGWTILTTPSHRFYNGIGRYGDCTGTLLDTGESETSPAYIVTNAHCVNGGLNTSKGYATGLSPRPTAKMYFHYYVGSSAQNQEIVVNKSISFASMDNTDSAIVELDTSLNDLKLKGICPFKIAGSKPGEGLGIENIGVPLSGVSNLGLRISKCTVGSSVSVKEGIYTFSQSFSFRCSIVGGNSGSPLISASDYKIVGLVNTTVNDSAESSADCALNKPCEVASDGSVSTNLEANYAQTIAYLAGCFNNNGVFDPAAGTCGIAAKFSLAADKRDRQ